MTYLLSSKNLFPGWSTLQLSLYHHCNQDKKIIFSLNKNILLGYEQRGFKSLSISSCAAFFQWRIHEKCVYSSFGEAHFHGKG